MRNEQEEEEGGRFAATCVAALGCILCTRPALISPSTHMWVGDCQTCLRACVLLLPDYVQRTVQLNPIASSLSLPSLALLFVIV